MNKFIAKEILIALSIITFFVFVVLIGEYYAEIESLHILGNYRNKTWFYEMNEAWERKGNIVEMEFNTAIYNHDKPNYDNEEFITNIYAFTCYGVFILVYPVRILYFLIKWSIKTLKST